MSKILNFFDPTNVGEPLQFLDSLSLKKKDSSRLICTIEIHIL